MLKLCCFSFIVAQLLIIDSTIFACHAPPNPPTQGFIHGSTMLVCGKKHAMNSTLSYCAPLSNPNFKFLARDQPSTIN